MRVSSRQIPNINNICIAKTAAHFNKKAPVGNLKMKPSCKKIRNIVIAGPIIKELRNLLILLPSH